MAEPGSFRRQTAHLSQEHRHSERDDEPARITISPPFETGHVHSLATDVTCSGTAVSAPGGAFSSNGSEF